MQVKSENYFAIQGFMRTVLNLKGNDLLVYAIIYGFSQTDNQRFTGSLQYLADWCGATKQGIMKNLNNLLERGLIIKEEQIINNVKSVSYYTTELHTIQLSLTNNIDNISTNVDIKNNTNVLFAPQSGAEQETFLKDTSEEKPKKQNLYQKCAEAINDFTEDEEVRDKLHEYLGVRLENKAKPLGFKSFESILKKLRTLTESKKECLQIIQQSIDRQYLSFFPLSKRPNYRTPGENVETISHKGEKKQHITKEEEEELRRLVESGELEEY